MKKLVLDVSKWRCGHYGNHQVGEGRTLMLNDEGFSCCLGQFLPQVAEGITDKMLLYSGSPASDRLPVVPDFSKVRSYGDYEDSLDNTDLSEKAVSINDNPDTTVEVKIAQLKELFAEHGYDIEVVNEHKITEL